MATLAGLGRAIRSKAGPPSCSCAGRARRSQASSSGSGSSSGRSASASWPECQDDDVSVQLREVMRNVAQPVAVAVARVPPSVDSPSRYHGATLTSFTSLTLHPYPLVAFSLRLPSRMADCLRPWISDRGHRPSDRSTGLEEILEPTLLSAAPGDVSSANRATPINAPNSDAFDRIRSSTSPVAPLTVSLLSAANTPIADALSRYSPDQSPIFASPEWSTPDSETTPTSMSRVNATAAPALRSAIGSLRCQVVQSIPLRDLCSNPAGHRADEASSGTAVAHHGSELFICRVVSVQKGSEGQDPLLHYQQRYVGVSDGQENG